MILPNLDADFKAPNAADVAPKTQSKIISLVDKFLQGVASDNVGSIVDFPRLDDIIPSDKVPQRPITAALETEDDEIEGEGDDMETEPTQNEQIPLLPTSAPVAPSGATYPPSSVAINNLAAQHAQHAALIQQQQQRMAAAAAAATMGPAAQQAQQFQALQMAMYHQQMAAAAGAMGVMQPGMEWNGLPPQHQLQYQPPMQQPPPPQ